MHLHHDMAHAEEGNQDGVRESLWRGDLFQTLVATAAPLILSGMLSLL